VFRRLVAGMSAAGVSTAAAAKPMYAGYVRHKRRLKFAPAGGRRRGERRNGRLRAGTNGVAGGRPKRRNVDVLLLV